MRIYMLCLKKHTHKNFHWQIYSYEFTFFFPSKKCKLILTNSIKLIKKCFAAARVKIFFVIRISGNKSIICFVLKVPPWGPTLGFYFRLWVPGPTKLRKALNLSEDQNIEVWSRMGRSINKNLFMHTIFGNTWLEMWLEQKTLITALITV